MTQNHEAESRNSIGSLSKTLQTTKMKLKETQWETIQKDAELKTVEEISQKQKQEISVLERELWT